MTFDDDCILVTLNRGDQLWECSMVHAYTRSAGKPLWRLDLNVVLYGSGNLYRARPSSCHAQSGSGRIEGRLEKTAVQALNINVPNCWEALCIDETTGCLCLWARNLLVILPDYAHYAFHGRIVALALETSEPFFHSSEWFCSAVTYGRAACLVDGKLVLVDLLPLLSLSGCTTETVTPATSNSDSGDGVLPCCIQYYSFQPQGFYSVRSSECLALTATHLVIGGERSPDPDKYHAWKPCTTPRPPKWSLGVILIDFARMRDGQVDSERIKGDKCRKKIWKKDRYEMREKQRAYRAFLVDCHGSSDGSDGYGSYDERIDDAVLSEEMDGTDETADGN